MVRRCQAVKVMSLEYCAISVHLEAFIMSSVTFWNRLCKLVVVD